MLLALLGLPFVAAAIAPLLTRWLGRFAGILLALGPAAGFVWLLGQTPVATPLLTFSYDWAPQLHIAFALRLDGLATAFALLVTGIGAIILIYASGYMRGESGAGRLYCYLLLFMGAMLGVVLADDLVTLFVFWELTSITSYLLIGFKHKYQESRDAALQALLITGGGGLALLAGLILLAMAAAASGLPAADCFRISTLLDPDRVTFAPDAFVNVALLLVLLGAFTKSAQWPFHFWLPGAMAAPTPVSAYLHSATMVKAGVFLLARMHPALGDLPLWQVLVTTIGAITMALAAISTIGQHDLKRILAFSTVSVLGTLTMLLGLGAEAAIKAAVVLLMAHALYKAALFLVAGSVDHATGTRDVTQLGGLLRAMPLTAAVAMLAALSQAGAPPLFGFIGKEYKFKAIIAQLQTDPLTAVLLAAAVVASIGLIAAALIVAVWPFFGARKTTPRPPHEVALTMTIGPLLLAVGGLAVGLAPGPFDNHIATPMASAIAGADMEMKLKLWHGLSPDALAALGLSALTLTLGFVLFWSLHKTFDRAAALVVRASQFSPARLYALALPALLSGAAITINFLQSGKLRRYMFITIAATVALVSYPLMLTAPPQFSVNDLVWYWYEVLLAAGVVSGAAITIFTTSRLAAAAALGLTGTSITLLLAVFSAPDLAITLVMVETLTVILLVLVLHKLPKFGRLRSTQQRIRDGGLAILAGGMMTALVLASFGLNLPSDVASQYAANSVPSAYGRNVVNVILVDFRALDTLGEIVVVAVAAFGVYALLRLKPAGAETRRSDAA